LRRPEDVLHRPRSRICVVDEGQQPSTPRRQFCPPLYCGLDAEGLEDFELFRKQPISRRRQIASVMAPTSSTDLIFLLDVRSASSGARPARRPGGSEIEIIDLEPALELGVGRVAIYSVIPSILRKIGMSAPSALGDGLWRDAQVVQASRAQQSRGPTRSKCQRRNSRVRVPVEGSGRIRIRQQRSCSGCVTQVRQPASLNVSSRQR
jgi:hypothetical protein